MSLLKQYHQAISDHLFDHDPAQINAINTLDKLLYQLNTNEKKTTLFNKLLSVLAIKSAKVMSKGVYFYGPVGRGKTMLMDMFYRSLITTRKRRIHFHHFMESVHLQLMQLKSHSDPLAVIARQWSNDIDILCFDELFVNDIADAMLLSGIFTELFAQNVILVATSNCHPDTLYKNGLQRQKFLPAISLLKTHCHVVDICGEKDHRLSRQATKQINYYSPCSTGNLALASHYFDLTQYNKYIEGHLTLYGREISYLSEHRHAICFDFSVLCSSPRSQRDYMKLATMYQAVFIINVPVFSGNLVPAVFSGVEDGYQRAGVVMGDLTVRDDEARRFIALVDEFYERQVKLVISAQVAIDELYQGKQLTFEFSRCRSRLHEMQSW